MKFGSMVKNLYYLINVIVLFIIFIIKLMIAYQTIFLFANIQLLF